MADRRALSSLRIRSDRSSSGTRDETRRDRGAIGGRTGQSGSDRRDDDQRRRRAGPGRRNRRRRRRRPRPRNARVERRRNRYGLARADRTRPDREPHPDRRDGARTDRGVLHRHDGCGLERGGVRSLLEGRRRTAEARSLTDAVGGRRYRTAVAVAGSPPEPPPRKRDAQHSRRLRTRRIRYLRAVRPRFGRGRGQNGGIVRLQPTCAGPSDAARLVSPSTRCWGRSSGCRNSVSTCAS